MQPLTAVADAARIALTFVLLTTTLVVVSVAGIIWWAGSALVSLFVREPERAIRPSATSR